MALRLKIVSDNAAAAGDHPRWTFGVNGGRIGRNSSNDWGLRDPDRYVSGRHAEIEHRAGAWLLRDTSTNGTFVNDSDEALGPDRVHQLSHGDRFRIGEYEIEVEITGSNDPTGVSCDGPEANTICTALGSGQPVNNLACNGRMWNVGVCGTDLELNAQGNGVCQCSNPGYTVRPCIGVNNANWGGVNTATCGGPTQTINVICG